MKPGRVEYLVPFYLLCTIRMSQHLLGNCGKGYFLVLVHRRKKGRDFMPFWERMNDPTHFTRLYI